MASAGHQWVTRLCVLELLWKCYTVSSLYMHILVSYLLYNLQLYVHTYNIIYIYSIYCLAGIYYGLCILYI